MLDCGIIKLVSVGDICNVSRGASPRPIKKYLTQSGEGVPWIKIGDVSPFNKYIKKTNERITQEGAKKSRFLHKGDLILSNSMSFGRPYILEIDGCIHDGWISLSGFENYVLRDFLYEVLNTKCVQDYWAMKANNGGAMSNLNSDIVKSTIIKIPSLNVQKEIVKILDSFTNLIDALNEELSLRQKQFEYYREKLLNSNECSKTEKLQYFAKIMNGKDYKHLGKGQIQLMGSGGIMGYVDSYLYNKKSVLLPRKGSIDKVYYIEEPFWTVDTLYWTKIDEKKIIPKFLYYILSSIHIENYALKGGIPSMTQSILYNIDVPYIDKDLQQSIVEKLDAFESLIASLKEEIALRQKQYEYYREKLLTFD